MHSVVDMALRLSIAVAVLLTTLTICIAAEDDLDKLAGNLRVILEDHFSVNRNHLTNPMNKDNAVDYIKEKLESYKLEVETMDFSGSNYEGTNVIGVMPGKTRGTADDKVVVLGTHFDTVETTPGVDDNGSGMAAFLEAARLVTSESCSAKNTIVFVAFDLEEYQQAGRGLLGSEHFVNDWLIGFLENSNGVNSSFQGAVVLETIMNFNSSAHTQELPQGFEIGFPDDYERIQRRNFSGDFTTVVGRSTDDAVLMSGFSQHWDATGDDIFKNEPIRLPFSGVPTEQDYINYNDFFRSDHTSFWRHPPNSLNAIFLTDTANFRGTMMQCYHEECDNKASITDEKMEFLAKITRTVADMMMEFAENDPEEVCAGGGESVHYSPILFIVTFAMYYLLLYTPSLD